MNIHNEYFRNSKLEADSDLDRRQTTLQTEKSVTVAPPTPVAQQFNVTTRDEVEFIQSYSALSCPRRDRRRAAAPSGAV